MLATFAGVRPVIDSGQLDPSKEAREHALWLENGLLTVTGGKLTTFRVIALDALRRAAPLLPGWQADLRPLPIFDATPPLSGKALRSMASSANACWGRHGAAAQALCEAAHDGELEPIPGTQTLWAQLRWGARREDVQHLDDLLLRRTRLGLQLAGGALAIMPRLRAICQRELGWDDARWEEEQQRYLALWRRHYSVPQGDLKTTIKKGEHHRDHPVWPAPGAGRRAHHLRQPVAAGLAPERGRPRSTTWAKTCCKSRARMATSSTWAGIRPGTNRDACAWWQCGDRTGRRPCSAPGRTRIRKRCCRRCAPRWPAWAKPWLP